jgi:outer membrane protein OmpA-like peptidoglycan-associated protein
MFKHILLFAALLCCLNLYGQQEYPWEFGVQLGVSSIGGDLSPNEFVLLNEPSPAGGITLRRRLGGILALRAQLMYARLKSDDSNSDDAARNARGFTSETSVIEPGLVIELEPFANKRFDINGNFKKILSPYIYGGAAYAIWQDPEVNFNGNTSAGVMADMNSDEGNSGLVIPGGVGIRYYLSPKTSLGLDFSVRLTSDDLIDGVSQSGNPRKDDSYGFMGLTLNVGFGKKDQDKDGIADQDDLCPTEAGPESTGGCPDTDGDGIADKDDACPTEAGLANLAGCPDADGDGVADGKDECPNEAGSIALNGCPDGDGDGIADKNDKCPDVAGTAALMGCPDQDGDGIADGDDRCPTVAGLARYGGCPDTDGDGIIDSEDECPTVAGVASRNGCPESEARYELLQDRIARYRPLVEGFQYISVDETTGTVQIENVYFDTNSSRLRSRARAILDEVKTFLARPGAEEFTIRHEGHADERYTEEYNMKLSEDRAGAAMQYLLGKEVEATELSMIGFGESQSIGRTLQENRMVANVANEPARRVD